MCACGKGRRKIRLQGLQCSTSTVIFLLAVQCAVGGGVKSEEPHIPHSLQAAAGKEGGA